MFPIATGGIVISETTINVLLAVQLATSGFLFGLIAIVQAEVYPFLERFEADKFSVLHAFHSRRITYVVAIPMVAELVISIMLVVVQSPVVNPVLAIAGLGLTIVIWISTLFVQVPLHQSLERSHSPDLTRRLTRSNWIRTVCWAARTIIALIMVLSVLS
ncbi:MAG: hypothetical protein HKN43_01560 [Rhodothermales bacterium]|nr:hypothetical protein [Rhodothermales bacterium]